MTRVCHHFSLSRTLSDFSSTFIHSSIHSFHFQRLDCRRYLFVIRLESLQPWTDDGTTTKTHLPPEEVTALQVELGLNIPSSTFCSSHLLSNSATPFPTSHHSRPVTSLRVGNSKLPERSIRSATFAAIIPTTTDFKEQQQQQQQQHHITTHTSPIAPHLIVSSTTTTPPPPEPTQQSTQSASPRYTVYTIKHSIVWAPGCCVEPSNRYSRAQALIANVCVFIIILPHQYPYACRRKHASLLRDAPARTSAASAAT